MKSRRLFTEAEQRKSAFPVWERFWRPQIFMILRPNIIMKSQEPLLIRSFLTALFSRFGKLLRKSSGWLTDMALPGWISL